MVGKRTVRVRGQRLTLAVLLAALVVAAAVAAALKWPGVRWWVPVALAGLAAAVAGVTPLWLRWREQRAATASVVRRSVLATGGAAGDRLPTVGAVDLRTLGVHAAVEDIPYVPRPNKERDVREHLLAERPVLLVGSSMVGKTRLAAEVVQDLYSDRPIVIPDTATALADLDRADVVLRNHVIWLDDLDRFLTGGGVTGGLVQRLARDNIVVATLRAREWGRLQPTDQLRPPAWDVLTIFEMVTLDRDRDQPNAEDLATAVPDAEVRDRIGRIGIGEYVGAAQHIADRLSLGAQSHPLGYALVVGAVDWKRTGLTRPVPAGLLPSLASAHLTPRQRSALADSDTYTEALGWATQEINPTVSLLEPGDGVYMVYDYALDQLATTDEPIPADTWQLATDAANHDELVAIGFQAEVTYGLREHAEQAWLRAADGGHTEAMNNLGLLLKDRGDLDEAESWWRRAADGGHTDAMNNLGLLLKDRGDLDEAESWWSRAADNDDHNAMYNLGLLLKDRGDLNGAEFCFSRAGHSGSRHGGHTSAMYNLGILLHDRGDLNEANTWYLKAAVEGHTEAMYNLGVLLKDRGDLNEAETWWRRAADGGHTDAMHNLGVLLERRGDKDEAESWYRRAADTAST